MDIEKTLIHEYLIKTPESMKSKYRRQKMKSRNLSRIGLNLLALPVLILFTLLSFPASSSSQSLKIYCIDVDQGSATLLVTPNNKSILIDCGDDNTSDSVYKIITEEAGLKSLDYFICTHYHDDHYGALDKLIAKGITINEKYYDRDSQSWLTETRKNSDDYNEYKVASAGKRQYLKPGSKINADNEVDIECFVANGRAKGEHGSIEYPSDENGYSLGLIISYKGFDFLIAGDLNEEVEPKLVQLGVLKDVDVYHVNHHGSETSSSMNFLNTIKPEVCIISSGTNGTYKHPRKKTLERLASISSVKDIYQINKNMDEGRYPDKIKNVPDEFIGDLDCQGDEGTIVVEVKEDTYTVRILDKDVEKVYHTQKL
jgi:competence protein ComEC